MEISSRTFKQLAGDSAYGKLESIGKHLVTFLAERFDFMECLKTEGGLAALIRADTWMMDILKTVEKLQLPDCWICAGFSALRYGILFMNIAIEPQLPILMSFISIH